MAVAWPDFLECYAEYLDAARRDVAAGRQPPDDPEFPRPDGPVPDEYTWQFIELLAQASETARAAPPSRPGVLAACRAVARRVTRRHSDKNAGSPHLGASGARV